MPPLRTSSAPVCALGLPTPFGSLWSPFPPDRGNQPSPRGRLKAAARAAPTARTGPGALVRRRQAQNRNCTSPKFLPAQAPSGAGRDRAQALLILRAGNSLPAPRDNPRNGVRGKATRSTGTVLLWSRPRGRFAYFAATGKVGRRPQAAKPPCAQQTQSETCPLIRHGFAVPPSPKGEGLKWAGGETPCINQNPQRLRALFRR